MAVKCYQLPEDFEPHTLQIEEKPDGTIVFAACSSNAYVITSATHAPEIVRLVKDGDQDKVIKSPLLLQDLPIN